MAARRWCCACRRRTRPSAINCWPCSTAARPMRSGSTAPARCTAACASLTEAEARRQLRSVAESLDELARIDYYPGAAAAQAQATLQITAPDGGRLLLQGRTAGAARAWHRPAGPAQVPGQALGHALAALGGPAGLRLADTPLHRPAGQFPVAGRSGRRHTRPARRARLRLRRRALHACRHARQLRGVDGQLRPGRRCEAAAPGRDRALSRRRRHPDRGRSPAWRACSPASANCMPTTTRWPPPPAPPSTRCMRRRQRRAARERRLDRSSPAPDSAARRARSRRLRRGLALLAEARLHQLRRAGRADRHHAQRTGRTPPLDQREAFPACAELLHAAARARGAAAGHLHRLADAPHLGRHRRRRAVRAALAVHPDRLELDLPAFRRRCRWWPACSTASSRP